MPLDGFLRARMGIATQYTSFAKGVDKDGPSATGLAIRQFEAPLQRAKSERIRCLSRLGN